MELERARTWAEVSLSALEHNYRTLRAQLQPGCRFLGVVKADAYGHGAVTVARELERLGCEMLAVAELDEALQLRGAGINLPILILGVTPVELAHCVVEQDLTQTVFTTELARALSDAAVAQGKTACIHVKLDTGMSRVGVLAHDPEKAASEVAELCEFPNLVKQGIFTHFADADSDEEFTMLQFTRFLDTVERLEKTYGLTFEIRHCAASAAALKYPCTHLDMVRPGIALYGHYPDPSCRMEGEQLQPVMSLYTRVAGVRQLPAGATVSYGCTRKVDRDSRVAVLPIGYGDGLSRLLSDRTDVLLGGKRAPVLGRICMDMCMVDATDLPCVQVGDVATVFGPDKPLEELADCLGTITYELLCDLPGRVKRICTE
ncbi:MAG: alanine racemase [Oscillospiraceae bacterium]|nr:alanine racemase [Oscillospiraceae bacterium]